MRALKIILGGLAAIIVVVLVVGLFLSKDYRVERSMSMAVKPVVVFNEVNSFQKWSPWSPWLAMDPTIKNTFSGPESGVGNKVAWTSEKSGSGSQTITLSESPSRIETALDFGEMGTATADWTFAPQGDGVLVTWGLTGTADGLLGGYFASMMDGWVGTTYEDGLLRLRDYVQGLPATPEATPTPAEEPEHAPAPDTVVDGSVPTPDAAVVDASVPEAQ